MSVLSRVLGAQEVPVRTKQDQVMDAFHICQHVTRCLTTLSYHAVAVEVMESADIRVTSVCVENLHDVAALIVS